MDAYENEIRLISGTKVDELLTSDFDVIISLIRQSYISHEKGKSSLPHSVFLRFPDNTKNRIIALPAYIENEVSASGIKWIASFPENINRQIARASATIILNSVKTGRPYCILEGSIISAKRTAASAALAVTTLLLDKAPSALSLIGCGVINFEIFKFVCSQFKTIENIYLYDINPSRSEQFSKRIKSKYDFNIFICENLEEVFKKSKIVSVATTSTTPYIKDCSMLQNDSLVLHISLRDFTEDVIHQCINIVDDMEHVNREQTSIHLTSKVFGNTDFVYASIGSLLIGTKTLYASSKPVIFSPFGLGILDIAVADYVFRKSLQMKAGISINDFFPSIE